MTWAPAEADRSTQVKCFYRECFSVSRYHERSCAVQYLNSTGAKAKSHSGENVYCHRLQPVVCWEINPIL